MESEVNLRCRLAAISQVSHQNANEDYFRQISNLCESILGNLSSNHNCCDVDSAFSTSMNRVLQSSLKPAEGCDTQTVTQCVTNCYRICRNLCAIYAANQNVFRNQGSFINTTCCIISSAIETGLESEEQLGLTRCAVQFLGNFASGNRENQQEVWQKLQNLFLQLLQVTDQKLQEYVLIVLHICLGNLASSLDSGTQCNSTWALIKAVIVHAVQSDSANGLLVIEDALRMPGLCEHVFKDIDSSSQLLLLEVLINCLKRLPEEVEDGEGEVGMEEGPSLHNLQFIAADFILQSHLIPKMTGSSSSAFEREALCTAKELEALCLATSHHSRYKPLQDTPSLASATVGLLQAVQELGRQGDNVFTSIEKMSHQDQVNPHHPVFGLKRDLIRLLGNLAYRHRQNQDLIRELEGLPLIMEQTNVDEKNPFITQWSVFALHNLTENNEDNRLYIANLKLEGVANNQPVLEEMGLTADTQGDKVVIKKRRTDR